MVRRVRRTMDGLIGRQRSFEPYGIEQLVNPRIPNVMEKRSRNMQWRWWQRPRSPTWGLRASTVAVFVSVGAFVTVLVLLPLEPDIRATWVVHGVVLVFFLLSNLIRFVAQGSARRRYAKNEFRFCPFCQYSLKGVPDEGTCPECGESYKIHLVQRIWQRKFPRWRRRRHPRPNVSGPERFALLFFLGAPISAIGYGCVAFALTFLRWRGLVRSGPLPPDISTVWFLDSLMWVVPATIVVTVVAGSVWRHLRRTTKRLIKANDFSLCPSCRLPLGSLPPNGLCPKCQFSYEATKVRELWEAEYYLYP